jgi:signal transduction histidine kinase
MRPRVRSFRVWLLLILLFAGTAGFVGGRLAIGHIQDSQERAGDHTKDVEIARAIAARVVAGDGPTVLRSIQSALPDDRILVYRRDRLVFAGSTVPHASFELQVSQGFPGGRVVVRDYHQPVRDSSLEVTLAVGASILLVIVVAVIAAEWLTVAIQRPIGRAAAAADRVAAGDYGARIGTVNPGEFGRLAEAFDLMADRLDAIDRDQRQFLADITHEIATPVNAISGLAGALADGTIGSDEQRADAAALIDMHTERLGSLLEDLRRLTRLDLAEPVRWEEVDLPALFGGVVDRFRTAAGNAGVTLSASTDDARVTSDPRLLETILDNLVSNAIRYTPAGGSVEIRGTHAPRAHVLAVRDTGIGIARDELERIFDRFYRTDRARDRATGGSGLGLALARRCAQAVDARIEVSSELGRGTEFRLVLPTHRSQTRHGATGSRTAHA